MRIGMITSTLFPPQEGLGFYVWNLSQQLTQQGHQVQIITRGRGQSTSREVVDGITIWRPPFVPAYPMHVHLHGVFVDRLVQKLARELDVVHVHSPLVQCPETKLPLLVTVHTPMKAATASISVTNMLSILIKLQSPVSYSLEQRLFDRADKVVAVASTVAQGLMAYGIDPLRVSVLGNGVDTNIFYPVRNVHREQDPYFLTAGRLAPGKGLEDLIQVAAKSREQFPAYRFLIAGTGPLEGELRSEIARRALEDRVILLGHIAERDEMIKLYSGAAAYVHPSHYEGLPTVMLEAMACGRPVVVTSVGGAPDVINHELNGLLISPRKPAQLLAALVRLVDNPTWAESLGQSAQETIQARYSWHMVSRNYVAEYEKLLAGVVK